MAMAAVCAVCVMQHSHADTPEQELKQRLQSEEAAGQDQRRFLQSGQQQWLRQLEQGDAVGLPVQDVARQPLRVVTQQDLLQQPQLLAHMLVQVLNSRPQPELLADLTALYAQTPQPDTVLLRRAQGMVAKYEGDYAQAVRTYGELAAEQPQDVRIRLDWAAMLAEDKQWRESKRLFEGVRREPEVPAEVQNNVQQYLDYIAKQQQWQWGGGLSPAFDDNVNNAPTESCPSCRWDREPESAAGIAYSLGVAKNQALGGHHNLRVQLDVSGSNYYWSNKSAYDSAYGRLGAGWLWQDARQRLLVMPFYQFQLSGTDNWEGRKRQNNHTLKMYMWAHAGGLRTEYSRLLTPRWQLYTALDAYRQRYRMNEKAEVYNGWYLGESVSLAWRATQRNTLYAGLSFNQMLPDRRDLPQRYYRPGTRLNDGAYRRYGVNAGWIHDWDALGGLSTRLNVSLAERRFRGETPNNTASRFRISYEQRRDRETQYSAAVWHRNWTLLGMTPKLNFSWQRIRSSHVWAERESKQVFLELERQF